jgi:hypothetical protein
MATLLKLLAFTLLAINDDIEANLTARAAQLGMQTIKFESSTQCERGLRRLGYF